MTDNSTSKKSFTRNVSFNIPYAIEGYSGGAWDVALDWHREVISGITGRDVTVVSVIYAGKVHPSYDPAAVAYIPDDLSKRAMRRWGTLVRDGILDGMILNHSEHKIAKKILPHEIVFHPEFRRAHFSRLMWYVKQHEDDYSDTYSQYAANSLYENIAKDSSLRKIIGDISKKDWSDSLLKDSLMFFHVKVKLKQLGIIR